MIHAARVICFTLLFAAFPFHAGAEEFTDAIHAYLKHRVEVENRDVGIVVGLVDEHGSRIVSCGKPGNGADQEANGDTVFEIGSVTKTFTALLLQDMVERGRMRLDDPVARYLPESVKVPTRSGKEITLRHLATHTSGLPKIPDNLDPRRADNPYADYTVEKLYAFLSGCQLTCDPGTQWDYSNLGMGLLGHAIALQAGTDYESLVVDRICGALKMDSTRITLTPELISRFAAGYNEFGYPVSAWDIPTLSGAGALRSTANDLLKYVSAHLGLTPSSLTPLMEKTHAIHFDQTNGPHMGLAWFTTSGMPGAEIILHDGGTAGHRAFAGFDKARRRGVVILSNSVGVVHMRNLGCFLLTSEWQSDRRLAEVHLSSRLLDSYAGQYRLKLDAPRGFRLWPFPRHKDNVASQSNIGIRREGDRLFVWVMGSRSWPADVFLPPGDGELLAQSETRFFERLSGVPLTFPRNARSKVTGLTIDCQGKTLFYRKISAQLPKTPEPLKPRIAVKLDTRLLDAVVGEYEMSPKGPLPVGGKFRIWREADQLVGQVWEKGAVQGAFDIFPESKTSFFLKLDDSQLTFVKNRKGQVTAVIHHSSHVGVPDCEGKKVK